MGHVIPSMVATHALGAAQSMTTLRGLVAARQPMATYERECQRCEAHLDGLRVATDACSLLESLISDDAELAAPLALLFAEGPPASANLAVGMLSNPSIEIFRAAFHGLRLANITQIKDSLSEKASLPYQELVSLAAWDILAFHRIPVRGALTDLPKDDHGMLAWLSAEAGGRTPGCWRRLHHQKYSRHPSPHVRQAALRASARSGLRELVADCRDAAASAGSLEAIAFLGVLGSEEDIGRLKRSAEDSTTAQAALLGMGRLGFPEAIPFLLERLSDPDLAESGSAAIQRITGQPVSRGPEPSPPENLSEEELDLWAPTAPVDASGVAAWWKQNSARFARGKRYQAGLCVSDAPLGDVFDQLPLDARYDVYLRERALTPGTPDWELETWPWKQRNPGAL